MKTRHALILVLLLAGCGSGVSITDSEVKVAMKDLDATFSRGEEMSETYMLFGATHFDKENLATPISLSGPAVEDAKSIYANHPDFHMCASPGAKDAMARIVSYFIVPADSGVLSSLKEIVAEFKESIQGNGARPSVRIEGSLLEMDSMVLRESGEDVTSKYPADEAYLLITSVEKVDTKAVLEGE